MPIPMLNILNGGVHAEGSSDFQEYKIAAIGAPNVHEAVRWSAEVFHVLKGLLHDRKLATTVGDEGGFAPAMESNDAYPKIIVEAIEKAGYQPGKDIFLVLDPAASSFYEDGKYNLKRDGLVLAPDEMIGFWEGWVKKYPIISIEDGLGEDDWDNWKKLNARLGSKIQIMGDDVFVTNPKIIKKAIEDKLANSTLIKLNQIGTVTETVEAVNLARAAGWTAVFSHRSGETEDTTIADMVVGLGTGMIKTGSASRSERVAKYNQLMRIEEELGDKAAYPGMKAFYNLGR
jgi:enolase